MFSFGYYLGRYDMTPRKKPVTENLEPEHTIFDNLIVSGLVDVDSGKGFVEPEPDATIILLPKGIWPETPFEIQKIRVSSDRPEENSPVITNIRESGGDYGRTNENGRYSLLVKKPGEYWILAVSRRTRRERFSKPASDDMKEMKNYFNLPSNLVEGMVYHWKLIEVAEGRTNSATFHFTPPDKGG